MSSNRKGTWGNAICGCSARTATVRSELNDGKHYQTVQGDALSEVSSYHYVSRNIHSRRMSGSAGAHASETSHSGMAKQVFGPDVVGWHS